MALISRSTQSARVRLLIAAINSINHETKIEVMMYENRMEILVSLVRERFGINDPASLFASPDVDDEIKEALQITMIELAEIKQARFELTEEFNQMIRDSLMEEKG